MIIIKIIGGLGNQMFQYAIYKSLMAEGKNVKLDTETYYRNNNEHNGYEIEKVFNINPNKSSKADLLKVADISNNIISKVRRKIFGMKKSKRKLYFYDTTEFKANPDIFKLQHGYMDGWWQSINYFENIKMDLKKDFTFKNKLDLKNERILKIIKESESVSLHIRRGDYMDEHNFKLYGNIATEEYYKNAIQIIKSRVEDPTFFIFSNDMEWVKNNLNIDSKVEYIDINYGADSYKDMQLMSNCKHNIIANSSFSWWGAWLNNNKNKIVIAPKKWINKEGVNSDEIELFYDDWILL